MTATSERQQTFLYTQKETKTVKLLYIHKTSHFSKGKTISVTFLHTKSKTFYVTRFFMNISSWHFYTKIMIICVSRRFYLQKA